MANNLSPRPKPSYRTPPHDGRPACAKSASPARSAPCPPFPAPPSDARGTIAVLTQLLVLAKAVGVADVSDPTRYTRTNIFQSHSLTTSSPKITPPHDPRTRRRIGPSPQAPRPSSPHTALPSPVSHPARTPTLQRVRQQRDSPAVTAHSLRT